jgi:N-acetylmuramoyl-L-alanine amidase
MNLNETYGSFTAQRVSEFQAYYGLRENGVADTRTLDKIDEILASPFREGRSHRDVIDLKEKLTLLGYGNMNINDVYGSFTKQRVEEFQKDHGLVVNGIFDAPSWTKLNSLVDELNVTRFGTVTASTLNVRNQASTNGSVVTQLSRGTVVQILGTESNGWHRIRVNGVTGYVSGVYINLHSTSGPLAGKVIILDAGHGGSDPGAVAGGMQEKELALDVSLRAQKLLEEAGATVIMTRTTDVYLTLAQRSSIANSSSADVFLSVHANAFNGSANGTETYWFNTYQSSNSQRLANAIQSATLSKLGLYDRGVKSGNFHVIRETRIPSALLELGFMDHSGDAAVLRQSSSRDRAAEAIRDGMINYFNN